MNVTIDMADETYKALLASGNRMRGSLALTSPTKGNFTAWKQPTAPNPPAHYIRLPHGKASVQQEVVRMTLKISLAEADVVPAVSIIDESALAATFVDKMVN